jgi:hypothetical protein
MLKSLMIILFMSWTASALANPAAYGTSVPTPRSGAGATSYINSGCGDAPWSTPDLAEMRSKSAVYVGFDDCEEGEEPCIQNHCCCGTLIPPCHVQCCDHTCVSICVPEGECCEL